MAIRTSFRVKKNEKGVFFKDFLSPLKNNARRLFQKRELYYTKRRVVVKRFEKDFSKNFIAESEVITTR